ncbi:hypothetical protein RQM59_00720 [Flavobacteriaceae bacterium S356]|uniref:Uncharacterized protein n=1 Tax=Asprobacillus argus TaxID=3076534 RepID=A0ABU3LAW4_9FLAO|nr:hypothetical protein [Flavobacteriaceae bacterium S356]
MMSPKEQLEFCKKCEKKTFNQSVGIICSLTNAKPNFIESCDDYVIDPTEVIRNEVRAKIKKEETELNRMIFSWRTLVTIIVVIVIIAIKIAIRFA